MSQVLAYDLDEIEQNLITEDDEPVDNLFSAKQQRLLVEPLYSSWQPPSGEISGKVRKFLSDSNVGVFYSMIEPPLVPDVFLSLDVEPHEDWYAKEHRSYFVWRLGKVPDVVLEIVSNRKGHELGKKLATYSRWTVNYYVVFDPTQTLGNEIVRVYKLDFENRKYIQREDLRLPAVGLEVGLWHGEFEGKQAEWLRWFDSKGNLIPTGAERAEKLAAKLRELGIDPNSV